MARGGIVRLLTLLIVFFSNDFALALAGGYGGGGGGGFGGGFGGGYGGGSGGGFGGGYSGASASSSSVSSSVGDAGYSGAGNNLYFQQNEQADRNHGGGQGDISVSVHKEVNLNGIKDGVHSLLGGILGGVSQLGGVLVQADRHPSNEGGIVGCRKCQNTPTVSIGSTASGNGAFAGSSSVGFESSSTGHKKHEKHHHSHHSFRPDVSSDPQIREQPNNGHAAGGVSIGGTFGINSAGRQNPPQVALQDDKPSHSIIPSVVIHKEITLGVGGSSSGSNAGGFDSSYGNTGFNKGKAEFTGNDNLSGCISGPCSNKGSNVNLNGNFEGSGCTTGSCGGSAVHGGAFNQAASSSIAGAHAGSIGLGLGNIVVGADQGNNIQKGAGPGCSDQSCGNASPQGNYNYNYSYGGSSSYSNAYATSFSSSSAASKSGSYGR